MDISKIILWNNCYILIRGKTVFNKRSGDKGIVRIRNLIVENNEIITSKLRELNLSPLDAFQLFSVIDALSKDWRHALKSYMDMIALFLSILTSRLSCFYLVKKFY